MPEPAVILLVEDDPNDAELALRALEKAELPGGVAHARDGQEALDYLFGEGPYRGRPGAETLRLVLLDLKLPRLDGLEVLDRMRADPRTALVPVVVLTSSMLPADVVDSYRGGANSFVVKPVEFSAHARALQEIGSYWLRLNVTPEP